MYSVALWALLSFSSPSIYLLENTRKSMNHGVYRYSFCLLKHLTFFSVNVSYEHFSFSGRLGRCGGLLGVITTIDGHMNLPCLRFNAPKYG